MELLCNIPALRTLKAYDYCFQGWKEAEGRVGKRSRAVTKKGEHALTPGPSGWGVR